MLGIANKVISASAGRGRGGNLPEQHAHGRGGDSLQWHRRPSVRLAVEGEVQRLRPNAACTLKAARGSCKVVS